MAGLAIEGNTKESEPHVIKQTGKVANLEEQIRGIVSVRLSVYLSVCFSVCQYLCACKVANLEAYL